MKEKYPLSHDILQLAQLTTFCVSAGFSGVAAIMLFKEMFSNPENIITSFDHISMITLAGYLATRNYYWPAFKEEILGYL